MNISDMAGNIYEMTNELYFNRHVLHGGSFNKDGEINGGYRTTIFDASNSNSSQGFRVALFVK